MFKKLNEIKPRILIIDDEPQIGEFLGEFLISKDYEVFYADNGEDGLLFVKKTRPHIILLDLRMPDMSGLEVLKKLDVIDPTIAVIMITAHDEEDLGREALSAGASDFITKPIDFEYLGTSLLLKLSAMLD